MASSPSHVVRTELAVLLLAIATTNVFNRLNVPTKTVARSEMPWS